MHANTHSVENMNVESTQKKGSMQQREGGCKDRVYFGGPACVVTIFPRGKNVRLNQVKLEDNFGKLCASFLGLVTVEQNKTLEQWIVAFLAQGCLLSVQLNLELVVLREDFVSSCDSIFSAFCPMVLSAWGVE